MPASKTRPGRPAALLASALAAGLSGGMASAATGDNPFAMTALAHGYQLAETEQRQEAPDTMRETAMEAMQTTDGERAAVTTRPSENQARKRDTDKGAEGKCGEGKCGSRR